MTTQYARAPHVGQPAGLTRDFHAALLIDFDNVTMGIRSDLSKELKTLLNSDIIKGKVAVQRAYADWRRYPQYIVPLAEASVDLIYAPAYGSQKKNATDIRLAIDALELVFTRPEIGTFILLSGDSDFSSLVLKLKEYAKYVIGVGIRESASDLLVQNCDEYYSYSALTGLRRTTEESIAAKYDPWELVELAVQRMVADGDVMRSDRLKQVLVKLDPTFDEKALGFSKYNRFIQEAAKRGALKLNKLENGQFEVGLSDGVETDAPPAPADVKDNGRRRGRRGRRRDEERAPKDGDQAAQVEGDRGRAGATRSSEAKSGDREADAAALEAAFALLSRATADVTATSDGGARDSDVKRRMLEIEPSWDESSVGFGKFSRFLRHADEARVINLQRSASGNYEVRLMEAAAARGSAGGAGPGARDAGNGAVAADTAGFDAVRLGLPVNGEAVINYLANSYKGVGKKSGQLLVDAFGADNVFSVMERQPERVQDVLGASRCQKLLDAWTADVKQRRATADGSADNAAAKPAADPEAKPRSRGRRGGRGRKKVAAKS